MASQHEKAVAERTSLFSINGLPAESGSILLMGTLFFLMSFLLHFPNLSPTNYSDIVSLYGRREVAGRQIPYLTFGIEYPVMSGVVIYLASLTGNVAAYYVLISFLIYGAVMASLVATLIICKQRGVELQRIILFLVATPSFVYYSIYSFDWFGVALTLVALILFMRQKPDSAAAAMGAAVAFRLIPILFIPVFLGGLQSWSQRVRFSAIAAVVWFAPNSVFMATNFSGWLHTYVFQANWGLEDTFLVFFFHQFSMIARLVSGALLLYLMLRIFVKGVHKDLVRGILAITLAFVISSFKVPPQYAIMLLPYMAVVPVASLGLFYVAELANLLIILTWFTGWLNLGNPLTPYSPTQWISAVRQLVWAVFLVKMIFPERASQVWSSLLRPVLHTA